MRTHLSSCAICRRPSGYQTMYPKNFNAKKHLTVDIFSARRLPDKIHGTIVKCKKCGLVRSKEVIKPSLLSALYSKSKFTYKKQTQNLKKTYLEIIKNSLIYTKRREAFLEIGCGNGFLFDGVSKMGFKKIRGIEPSADAIKKAPGRIKNKISMDLLNENSFSSKSFDYICAFQVFDHIQNPNNFLKICRKILKKRGLLVLMNHDVSSFSARFLGEKSPIFDIEHTYLYDLNTIEKIVNKNYLKVLKVYKPPAYMSIRYLLRLLPIPKSIKVLIQKINWSALDTSIKIYPGNLCLIAQKI